MAWCICRRFRSKVFVAFRIILVGSIPKVFKSRRVSCKLGPSATPVIEALPVNGGMATEQVLHMNGGVGDTSYANNSLLQRKLMFKAKPVLEESIKRLYSTILPQCLTVADLGCSSGPNALLLASDIIDIVDTVTCGLNHKPPIFQFFLNDLFGNDFNTIFKSLPEFYKALGEKKGCQFGPCFINATPGTFYKRLFPNNSMHFFHSSCSLHWLSQAPKELTNGAEPLNKDNIYLTSTFPQEKYRAYLGQFQRDLKLFLKLRSEELVPGGGMVLTLLGREDISEIRTAWGLIGKILNDMVSENSIEEVKLASFNLPFYGPTAEEVKQVIEEEGSFTLERLETIIMGWDANINEDAGGNVLDENMRGKFIAKYIRAITEPLLMAQFGEGVMDELFLRFNEKVVQLLMEVEKLEFASLVVSLIKNA